MAFSRYRPDLRARHKHPHLHLHYSNPRSVSHAHASQNHDNPYASNLTRQLTGGMQQLYQRIQSAEKMKLLMQSQPSKRINMNAITSLTHANYFVFSGITAPNVDPPTYTRPDGHLIISDKLPLLHK